MDTSNKNKTGDDNVFRNMIRVGYVSSQETDDTRAAGRVVYPDRENLVSEPLPILQKSSSGDQDYWSPNVGEQVVTVHLPNGIHKGFILGSFQSTSAPPPVTDPNKRHTTFKDGSVFEFDKGSSQTFIHTQGGWTQICVGPIYIETNAEVTIKGPVKIDGPLEVNGTIEATDHIKSATLCIDSTGSGVSA